MSSLPEKFARPARGAVQAVPAVAIVEFIDAFGADFTARQYGAAVIFLSLLFSFVQAAVEDLTNRGFLRRVPPKQVPVVDGQAGYLTPVGAAIAVVTLLVVLLVIGAF